jgi:hypothetical protein
MHELTVIVSSDDRSSLAALGLVRQLPALTQLDLEVCGEFTARKQWPPFIPPSLKALRIDLESVTRRVVGPLLRALPGMLVASGARLDRLELILPPKLEAIGDGLVHVAQDLRCCSPSLKGFLLGPENEESILSLNKRSQGYARQVTRLRGQWMDVLAGVSACRELQVLVLPRIEVEPLFPPGTAFGRLTHLEISDHERVHRPDAGVLGLWELMASGGLPALAKLKVTIEGGRLFGHEVKTRVAPAFEAVAGTLTHLHLSGASASDEVKAGYEWGAAVGKLRRFLKDLALSLSADGRVYHAFTQGLAASGGERPLPLLWRVVLPYGAKANADLLASLLLPNVRVFVARHSDDRGPFLTACAVRRAGYRHTMVLDVPSWLVEDLASISCIVPSCTVGNGVIETHLSELCVSRLRELAYE